MDDGLLRMPINEDAERMVLGSILLDDSFYGQVAGSIRPDDFALEKHRRMFRRMGELSGRSEAIDRVTLANELMKHGELESCDGISYLVSLDDGLPRVPNLDSYIRIIRDKSTLRKIVFSGQALIGMAVQPDAEPVEILTRASTEFLSLADTGEEDSLETPHQILEAEIDRAGVDAFLNGGVKGISTPIPWLNETIVGLQKGDLLLLGARPSVGKTALALQMAHHAALGGHGCVFFSLEMGKVALSLRIACSVANVDSQALRLGLLTREDGRRLLAAVADIKGLPLWIDKSSRTVQAMHAKIRRARTRVKVDAAWVDYIQLMSTEGRTENQNAKVSEISRGLKLMAEEFLIPVVALSQLSRPPKGTNPEPTLADLRDSGSLEQDADVVTFLHSPDGKLGGGVRRLIVAKQRNGPVGSADVSFVGKFQRFEVLAQQPEPEGY